jgi:hypothetical protein
VPFEIIVVWDVVFIGFGLCGVVIGVFVYLGGFVCCFFWVLGILRLSGFVVATGGVLLRKEAGSLGPRRISKKEIQETFSSTFRIDYIKDAVFATKNDEKRAKAT